MGFAIFLSVVACEHKSLYRLQSGDELSEYSGTPIFTFSDESFDYDVYGGAEVVYFTLANAAIDNASISAINVNNDSWVNIGTISANSFTISVSNNPGAARTAYYQFSYPGFADVEIMITQDGIPEIVTGIDDNMLSEGWSKDTATGTLSLVVDPEESTKELSYSIANWVSEGKVSVEIPTDAEWLSADIEYSTDSTGVIYFKFVENMKLARSTDITIKYSGSTQLDSETRNTSSELQLVSVTQKIVDINPGDYFCVEGYGSSSPGDWYIYNRTKAISGIPQNEVVGIVFSNNTDKIGEGEKDALGGAAYGLVIATKYANTSTSIGTSQMSPMSAWSNSTYFGENRVSTIAGAFDEMEGYANTMAVWNHTYYKENTGLLDPSGSAEGSLFPAYQAIKNCNNGENNNISPVPSTTTGWFMPSIGQLLEFYEQLGGTTLTSARSSNTDPSDDPGYFSVSVSNTALNEWLQYLENKHDFYSTDRLVDTIMGFCSSSGYATSNSTYGYIYHPSLGFDSASSGQIRIKTDPGRYYEVRPVLAF